MGNKLTIKVTRRAYYKGSLVEPNTIIRDYEGEIPTWATLANGKDGKPDIAKNKNPEKVGQVGQEGETEETEKPITEGGEGKEIENPELDNVGQEGETEVVVAGDGGVHEVPAAKTEVELLQELDALLDESVAKGIILENADRMTLDEQIAELKKLLGKE